MSTVPGPELFGRDSELRSLFDLLDRTRAGGAVIGLVGEPGMGKSALLRRVAEHAGADGFTVLSAWGSRAEAQLPFAGLHQLLRPLLPGVGRLPARQRDALLGCFAMGDASEQNPFFTYLAVLELLAEAAAQAPVLVTLDDIHWLDRPSVDALAFVARRIAGERIAILTTARPGPLPFGDDASVTWVEVTGLDEAGSTELLDRRAPALAPALRDRVFRDAAGNPLALIELAAALESDGPHGTEPFADLPMTLRLERTFVARADELGPGARAVLDVAALDEGDTVGDVLAAAALLDPSPVDLGTAQPALDVGLLTVAGGTFRISHPLVGSALRRAMSSGRRRQAHAALGRTLSGQPDRAIWHRAMSMPGPDEQVAAELERAAADARRRGAMATAFGWLDRAAELSPDPQARAARLLTAAEIGYEMGLFDQVEQIKARLSELPLSARDRSRRRWLDGAFHDGSTSEPDEIRHLVDFARQAIADADTDLAVQLLFGAARRVWWRDPGPQVRQDIVRTVRAAGLPADDPRLLAVLALADAIALGPAVTAELARRPDDAQARPEFAGLLGIAAFCVGDFDRADVFLSVAVQELRGQGRLSLLAEALAIRAWVEINLGVFDAARSADEAVRLTDETGQAVWGAAARVAVALIEVVHGGPLEGGGRLERAERTALQMPNASSSLLAGAQLARGMAALGADSPEPAYGELQRVFVPTDPACQQVQQLWTISYLADAAVRTGRRDETVRLLARMEQAAGGSTAIGPTIALEYSRAVLAGDDDAEELFRAALDGAGRTLPWHRARLQLAYGSWLRRRRRVAQSREPLRAARGTFDSLGATGWAHRADRELRATGERGWRPASIPRAQLSPQEAQIAELAAQGLSNREIGQRLFLSHRTVSSHLYRAFPKLGITSRNQLAGALARDDVGSVN